MCLLTATYTDSNEWIILAARLAVTMKKRSITSYYTAPLMHTSAGHWKEPSNANPT